MNSPSLQLIKSLGLSSDNSTLDGSRNLREYNFKEPTIADLLILAGGFERRALAFIERLRKSRTSISTSLILQYESQPQDNDPNRKLIESHLKDLTGRKPEKVLIHAQHPLQSSARIRNKLADLAASNISRTALIDISGMTHLWALTTIDACITCGFRVSVVYTEARWYFPSKSVRNRLVNAWKNSEYEIAVNYLQSAGLDAVHIPPEFAGNFRPSRQTCLIIFVGYEPNRVKGLIEDYAPGALIVFYGRSPHGKMDWRTDLSKELHRELFDQWLHRESEISTLEVDQILERLEEDFGIIQHQYDVAIAPQCSKMQALAAYLFWKKHPEVQLVFTSPVYFMPERYSKGAGQTFIYRIN